MSLGIAVLIPSYRGRAHLEVLLPSLASQNVHPTEIWISDSEEDGSRELARDFGAEFLKLPPQSGFAISVNSLMAASQAPHVAILNNDLRLAPNWLATLQPHLEKYPFTVGKLRHWERPDILDGTWDQLSLAGMPIRTGHGKRNCALFEQAREVYFSPWTAILLRRDYFRDIGPLDESFHSFFEDVDFGLRSLSAGHRGYYEPQAEAWHRGSGTLGAWHPRQVELSARNQLLFLAKHGGLSWLRRWPKEFWVGQLLSALAAYRHSSLRPWWRGKRSAWRSFVESPATLNPQLAAILEGQQEELFSSSQEGGLDPFWRYYWALTL